MSVAFRKTSAWLPIAMSLAALSLVVGYVTVFGVAQEPPADEGVAARLFQLLLVGQFPIVAFFVIRWLPQMPVQASRVLAAQFAAAFSAIALVFVLER